jgi:hypothetical protein
MAFLAGPLHAQTPTPKGDPKPAAPKAEAAAKDAAADGDISFKAVKLITGFALATIPSEVTQSDGTVLKIDRNDPSKLLVPFEDARRVIRVAYLSAQAQQCDMPDVQTENYLLLIREQRAKNKFTEQQMLFISRLHLFTVMWLTGNVKIEEGEVKEQSKEASPAAKPEKKVACSEEEKKQVRSKIESFWNTDEKKG